MLWLMARLSRNDLLEIKCTNLAHGQTPVSSFRGHCLWQYGELLKRAFGGLFASASINIKSMKERKLLIAVEIEDKFQNQLHSLLLQNFEQINTTFVR